MLGMFGSDHLRGSRGVSPGHLSELTSVTLPLLGASDEGIGKAVSRSIQRRESMPMKDRTLARVRGTKDFGGPSIF